MDSRLSTEIIGYSVSARREAVEGRLDTAELEGESARGLQVVPALHGPDEPWRLVAFRRVLNHI